MKLTRLYSVLFATTALLFTVNANAEAEKAQDIQCLFENLSQKEAENPTPVEWFKGFVSCAQSENYSTASIAFAIAGSSAKYDTYRVDDISAHQAGKVMVMQAFQAIDEDKRAAFQSYLIETFADADNLQTYCVRIKALNPPAYHPEYMINHGMKYIQQGNSDGILVAPTDPVATWHKSVDEYLNCSAVK